MIGPLMANVEMSERLIKVFTHDITIPDLSDMA